MEKRKVKASFIIVNWNGEKTIVSCLDSVFAQTYKNFEIIFIDNHSSDQSLEIVKKNYSVDKLISLDRNYGFAQANNLGLTHASGEYLALINNDTVLEKDWLEKAVSMFEKSSDKNLASVATKIVNYYQRDLIDTAGVEFYGLGACWDYKNLPRNSELVNRRKEVFGACASAALYKKNIIEEAGLFDPQYFMYFEDTDLSFRLRLFGYKCNYEPEAVCYHFGARRRERKNKFFIEYGRRNIEFLFIKNMQGYLFLKYFLSHCLYELVLFFFYLSAGRAPSFLKAKMRVLNNLGYLLKERKKLKLKLIKRGKYRQLYQAEKHFLPFKLRSILNKFRKAVWDYKAYLNSGETND